jgi:hypothetical protein
MRIYEARRARTLVNGYADGVQLLPECRMCSHVLHYLANAFEQSRVIEVRLTAFDAIAVQLSRFSH